MEGKQNMNKIITILFSMLLASCSSISPVPAITATQQVTPTSEPQVSLHTPTPKISPTSTALGSLLPMGRYGIYMTNEKLYAKGVQEDLEIYLADTNLPPSLSPDNDKIAINNGTQITIINIFDDVTNTLSTPFLYDIASLVWSPDGNILAFTASSVNPPDEFSSIYIVKIEEDVTYRITPWETIETSPAWSPDGSWLVFAADIDKITLTSGAFLGATELYLMGTSCLENPETCADTFVQVTDMGADGASTQPFWSSNSRFLAFTCAETISENGMEKYQQDICLLDIQSKNLTRLTDTPNKYETNPSWSPNQEEIAFVRYEPNTFSEDVFVITIAGKKETNLTALLNGIQGTPHWSPDGGHIAITDEPDTGNTDIFIVSIKDGSVFNWTNTPKQSEYFISWLIVKE